MSDLLPSRDLLQPAKEEMLNLLLLGSRRQAQGASQFFWRCCDYCSQSTHRGAQLSFGRQQARRATVAIDPPGDALIDAEIISHLTTSQLLQLPPIP